ncbi:hypothetical protein [Cellvibrio japonicus]|uniref:hypothetical protein n=1 Tax=Cellvibrio japonicus TaxID=155077 RepID=UPI0011D0EF41|nr:hypothetical protein [Cellvibrio japonicus]QEI11229.1 hypothetical protein FY117_02595 [Cellvibrio japonicus]QEI14803.1 hypothetical protein FY116_02595 [Cellvibrio japonicus]QEI18383.1 hypothetical protein FY115_02595 [Cellvibrio japonicus]
MENHSQLESKPLPRWVTFPLGIILLPVTLVCVIGSSTLLFVPNIPPSFLTIAIGSIFLAGSLWTFYLSFRLLFVPPRGGTDFISPFGLRAIALVFAVIPIISLFLGTFWEKPIIHSIMTIAYIGIVIQLWGMAKQRDSKN